MLGNFFNGVRRGIRVIPSNGLKVFGILRKVYGNVGIIPLLRVLPIFGTNQAVTCTARFPALHRNQTCKYVSSKCHGKGLEVRGNSLIYQGKQYPITPLKSPDGGPIYNVQGHRLFAINTADDNYKDFEGKTERNKVLVIACDGNSVVDPVSSGGDRKVMLSVQHSNIYPFSFSIVNQETGQRDWLLSFLMLPLNLSGLTVGCAGRLAASVLAGAGLCCEKIVGFLSKNIDRDIIHQSSGVVTGGGRPYFRTCCIFLLSMIANSLRCSSCVVKNAADFSEAMIRVPSAIANGVHNENMSCLPVTAGFAAIVKPAKSVIADVKGSYLSFAKDCMLLKARVTGDADALRQNVRTDDGLIVEHAQDIEEQQKGEGDQKQKKKMSRRDLEEVRKICEDLGSQIMCGTKEDISKELTKHKKAHTKAVQ
ncbi:Uncharacterized protein ehr_00249 [Ehrlichia minasensis]|nr:Uncharacterized protein ehr_00249 [Ehrlichia minasensis]